MCKYVFGCRLSKKPTDADVCAHHLHSLGQVRHGLKRGLPCLILIRNPQDAVLSLAIRKDLDRLDLLVREYIDFYSGIEKVKSAVVIADFEKTTTDFGRVIDQVNEKFGTHFARFEHTKENVEACYREIDQIERDRSLIGRVRSTHVARPSAERTTLKLELEGQLESVRLQELLERAVAIYEELTTHTR